MTRSDPTSGELSPAKTATLGRFGTGRHASVASPAARPGHHEVEPSSLTKAQQSRRQRITLLALTTRRGACFDSSIVAFAIAESIVGDLLCPELLSFCVHVARGLSAYLGMYVCMQSCTWPQTVVDIRAPVDTAKGVAVPGTR